MTSQMTTHRRQTTLSDHRHGEIDLEYCEEMQMFRPVIKLKKNVENPPQTPFYATFGAAGADIRSAQDVLLDPGARQLVETGYNVEVPQGYMLLVLPRSGNAAKLGVTVLNSPGLVDADYRGPLKIILVNHSSDLVSFQEGDRIAQLVLVPAIQADYVVVDELSDTARAAGGFGSTGKG